MSVAVGQMDILEALAQREASMARVAASADKGYRRELDDAIEWLAEKGDPFCADEIRVIAGEPPAGCSANLIGAVVNAAIKRGTVEVVGLTHSTRVIGHGNRLLLLKGRACS